MKTNRIYYGHDFPNCYKFEEFVTELIHEQITDFQYDREEDCVWIYDIDTYWAEKVDALAESHGWENQDNCE